MLMDPRNKDSCLQWAMQKYSQIYKMWKKQSYDEYLL